jgi:hypothetical protein
MALEQDKYGDPLKVLIRAEEKICKGCKHEKTEKIFGLKLVTCKRGRAHGKRCKYYMERES